MPKRTPPANAVQLAEALDVRLTREAERSYRAFLELLWPVLEPHTPFRPGPHIDFLCEMLEQVCAGRVMQVVINIPPRYGKSYLVSVFFPVWWWLHEPGHRFLCVSHSDALAERHALLRRQLIEAHEFQRRWGTRVQLRRDQRSKRHLQNTQGGVLHATSVGAGVTGFGGHVVILDDPHTPDEVETPVQRQRVHDMYRATLATRHDDKHRAVTLLAMQRLHADDLAARLPMEGATHLCLPAFAPARQTLHFPRSGRTWVRRPDDVLWPAHESRAQLLAQQQRMGSRRFTEQYQTTGRPVAQRSRSTRRRGAHDKALQPRLFNKFPTQLAN